MYLDMPAVELSEELMAATFRESPYRWPIIGWEADIRGITRDDVMRHYRRYYAPGNAALVVVGDVDADEVFAAAEGHFGAIPGGDAFDRRISKEPPWRTATRIELSKTANLPHLQLLFRAPEIRSRDSEALYLLAHVLGGTKTSRLDLALLETNKAGEVHVQYHAKTDPSSFLVAVEGQPEVGLDEVEDILWRELGRLGTEEVETEELERALNQVEAHHLFAMQSPSNRGFILGWHEAHGEVTYADEIVERLRALKPADLRDTAARHFQRERSGTARLIPNGSAGGAGAGVAAAGAARALFPAGPGTELTLAGVSCPRRRFRSGLASVPVARRVTLANGMKVLLQSDRTDPVTAVSFLFHGGAVLDPVERQGLAALTVDTLERGTKALEFVEFSRRFERIGSNLSLEAGTELVHGNAMFLRRHLGSGLSLIADLLEEPGYRDGDLEIVRRLALNDLDAREDDLDDVAEDAFLRGVAPEHPYSKLPHGTRNGLAAVVAADLRSFHAEAYRSDEAHLAIVGDFDESEIDTLLAERFARLRAGGGPRLPVPSLDAGGHERVVVRTRPEKAQAKIFFGGSGLSATDPDRFAAVAMNHVLGASSIRSRLGDEIRDNQGLAYSVSSRNYERSAGGFFFVHLGTRPENVRRAVDAIRGELAKIAEGVTDAELADAKDYLTGSFPLRFTTYGRLARFWARSSFYEWPQDYLATYPDRIRALTAADLRRVAQRLVPNVKVLSVAGPVNEDLEPVGGSPGNG